MENELIYKKDVLAFIPKDDIVGPKPSALREYIEGLPTIGLRCGEWIKEPGVWHMHDTGEVVAILSCSRCRMYYQNGPYNYCPHCGAKMKGKEEY